MTKHIQYSKEDRDFSATLIHDDGQRQYIGSYTTYQEAEHELDSVVFDLLQRGIITAAVLRVQPPSLRCRIAA